MDLVKGINLCNQEILSSIQCIYFVKLIPKYFILGDAIINAIVFLIFFFDFSLLVYRNINDFCVLILCAAILLIFY